MNNMEETGMDNEMCQEALQHLKNFRSTQKLQQATWVYLCNILAKKKDKKVLGEVFKKLDTDNDGKLSKKEVEEGWNKAFNQHMSVQEIQEIFDHIDVDKSGVIDYSEFIMATLDRKKLLCENNLRKVFKIIDKDGSGTIDSAELKAIF